MIATTNKKEFLTTQVMELLKNLTPDTQPNFGLMTPQHMVEHLVYTLKSTVKRIGEPENPPTERQLGFQRFIQKGAIFEHRPSSKTKADLPALKYDNLEDAVAQVDVAIRRFYDHFAAQPDFKCYNPFFGEMNFQELELFHFMHYRYHFWQFGLLDSYPQRKA